MKFYLNEVHIPVTKCKRPKFSDVNGRTWDSVSIQINDVKTLVYLDTTWGEYVYFEYDGSWRKVKMISSNIDDLKGKTWDLNPFDNPKPNLITK